MPSDTSTLRLDDQLCFALYAATNAIVTAYRPLLAQLGLTYPQYVLLMVLWEGDDVAIQQIARRLGVLPHGLTPVLDRLVASGLVTRAADPDDGRVVRIRLTDAGTSLEGRAVAAQADVVCRTRLTPEHLAQLRDQLHDLTSATREATDGAASTMHGT